MQAAVIHQGKSLRERIRFRMFNAIELFTCYGIQRNITTMLS